MRPTCPYLGLGNRFMLLRHPQEADEDLGAGEVTCQGHGLQPPRHWHFCKESFCFLEESLDPPMLEMCLLRQDQRGRSINHIWVQRRSVAQWGTCDVLLLQSSHRGPPGWTRRRRRSLAEAVARYRKSGTLPWTWRARSGGAPLPSEDGCWGLLGKRRRGDRGQGIFFKVGARSLH